eukprot:TRINITY_DN17391_c0_g1_i2.p1 TRINITY_DN17391_c0_g1~~TRINITY_DN17391_c0_g1_i2.p1  ORF type:complete len:207 (+),score=26.70 TRINITY_DN17391_c0_g1_i2:92-712(+)
MGKEFVDAAACSDLQVVRTLLKGGRISQSQKDLALCHACSGGHLECVQLLLEAGASPSALNPEYSWKVSALSTAAEKSNLELVKLLLKAGADPNIGTPLERAGIRESLDIVQLLVQAGADVNRTDDKQHFLPLFAAVIGGNVDIVRFLIQAGANVNATKPQWRRGWWSPKAKPESALHVAATRGKIEIVKILLEAQIEQKLSQRLF